MFDTDPTIWDMITIAIDSGDKELAKKLLTQQKEAMLEMGRQFSTLGDLMKEGRPAQVIAYRPT